MAYPQPTIENLVDPRYTDVVLFEDVDQYSFFSRDVITVNNTAGGTYKQGTIVWRVKGSSAAATWDIVDAAGDINVANEYGILIGNDFEPAETITFAAGVSTNAIAIVRRARVKERVLKDIHVVGQGLTETNFADLKRLLAKDGILVDGSLTAIPA